MHALVIFKQLTGEWKFKRNINDILTESWIIVEGKAIFTAIKNNQYLFNETGVADLQTTRFATNQQYLYILNDDSNVIEVHSANNSQNMGKLFEINTNHTHSQHICSADSYHATFDFGSDDAFNTFSIEYVVQGPRKNYRSTTIFTRA